MNYMFRGGGGVLECGVWREAWVSMRWIWKMGMLVAE